MVAVCYKCCLTLQSATVGTNSLGALGITTSSIVTGWPTGTTFNPSSITTTGTYTLSSSLSGGSYILVTLPSGFAAGTYTGTYTVLTSVNLTLQTATISSSILPKTTTTLHLLTFQTPII